MFLVEVSHTLHLDNQEAFDQEVGIELADLMPIVEDLNFLILFRFNIVLGQLDPERVLIDFFAKASP